MPASKCETPHIREMFIKYGRKLRYDANCQIAQEGDEAKELCYITRGEVRAFCASPDGDELTLFYIGADNMIFTEALVESPSRILRNAETTTAVEMYALDASQFLQLWTQNGYPIQELMIHTVRRFELLHEYICCAHFKESDKRVAYLLYTSCKHNGKVIHYTHEQIASITGINRVSVSRIINQLVKEGALSQGYRKIEVLDTEKLSSRFNAFGCGFTE